MRVTSKGQVTIPKNIRERLGIEPGNEVEFVETDDGVKLEKQDAEAERERRIAKFDRWLKKWAGTSDLGMTTDEYMALIRDRDIPVPDDNENTG